MYNVFKYWETVNFCKENKQLAAVPAAHQNTLVISIL